LIGEKEVEEERIVGTAHAITSVSTSTAGVGRAHPPAPSWRLMRV
jgi:hypothetical protein